MKPIVDAGHVPVISAMGNMPIVKDLAVDMTPFWSKVKAMKPWLEPGFEVYPEGEYRHSQEAMNPIHKEALCIMCGCCVSECNSMEADPEFLGPAALAKGFRFVGDPRDRKKVERLELYNSEHGIWDCTRCYFCNERCPKGVDPRDAIAKLGAESIKEGIDRDLGAKHAKWFVRSAETTGWLRETELVPKTQGVVEAIKQTKFAIVAGQAGQGSATHSAARGEGRRRGACPPRAHIHAGTGRRPRPRPGRACARADRAHGRRRRSTRRARDHAGRGASAPRDRGSAMKVAYYKGCLASLSAKELDTSTQALAPKLGHRARGARRGHMLRCR